MENTALNKSKTSEKAESNTGLDTVSIVSIGIMGFVSAAIGLWSMFCFANILFENGPLATIKSFVSAVSGL